MIALDEIRNNDVFDQISVVIPGYCGDLFGGSYLIHPKFLEDDTFSYQWLASFIMAKHFDLYKIKQIDRIKVIKDISDSVYQESDEENTMRYDELISNNEEWFTRHKVSKFVVNATRMFEFVNLKWRIPLWDSELMNFWYQIPNEFRGIQSRMYTDWLFKELFQPMMLDYRKPDAMFRIARRSVIKEHVKVQIKRLNNLTGINIRGNMDINLNSYLSYQLRQKIQKNTRASLSGETNGYLGMLCVQSLKNRKHV